MRRLVLLLFVVQYLEQCCLGAVKTHRRFARQLDPLFEVSPADELALLTEHSLLLPEYERTQAHTLGQLHAILPGNQRSSVNSLGQVNPLLEANQLNQVNPLSAANQRSQVSLLLEENRLSLVDPLSQLTPVVQAQLYRSSPELQENSAVDADVKSAVNPLAQENPLARFFPGVFPDVYPGGYPNAYPGYPFPQIPVPEPKLKYLQDPNDPQYAQAAQESLYRYGYNYVVSLVLQATAKRTPLNDWHVTVAFTAVDNYGYPQFCYAEIVRSPSTGQTPYSVQCQPDDPLLRPLNLQNPNDPRYQVLASQALQRYLAERGNNQYYWLSAVLRATERPPQWGSYQASVAFIATGYLGELRCYAELLQQGDQQQLTIDCNPRLFVQDLYQ